MNLEYRDGLKLVELAQEKELEQAMIQFYGQYFIQDRIREEISALTHMLAKVKFTPSKVLTYEEFKNPSKPKDKLEPKSTWFSEEDKEEIRNRTRTFKKVVKNNG